MYGGWPINNHRIWNSWIFTANVFGNNFQQLCNILFQLHLGKQTIKLRAKKWVYSLYVGLNHVTQEGKASNTLPSDIYQWLGLKKGVSIHFGHKLGFLNSYNISQTGWGLLSQVGEACLDANAFLGKNLILYFSSTFALVHSAIMSTTLNYSMSGRIRQRGRGLTTHSPTLIYYVKAKKMSHYIPMAASWG